MPRSISARRRRETSGVQARLWLIITFRLFCLAAHVSRLRRLENQAEDWLDSTPGYLGPGTVSSTQRKTILII